MDKWKDWNQKKKENSAYDSGAWEKSDADYEKAKKGATEPGAFERLKSWFSDDEKKKKKE